MSEELISMAELFKKKEYSEKLESSKEKLKIPDMLDRPIIITGYSEESLIGQKSGVEEPCFKLSFIFADDEDKIPHYVSSQAKRLWEYLKAVNEVDPGLLNSGTVTTMIVEGQLKGKYSTKYYYFAGTE